MRFFLFKFSEIYAGKKIEMLCFVQVEFFEYYFKTYGQQETLRGNLSLLLCEMITVINVFN